MMKEVRKKIWNNKNHNHDNNNKEGLKLNNDDTLVKKGLAWEIFAPWF